MHTPIRALVPALALIAVVSSIDARAQGVTPEELFRRFLVSGDTAIASVLIRGDSVYGTFCRAVMNPDPLARRNGLARFIAMKPAVGVPEAHTWRGLSYQGQDMHDSAVAEFNAALAADGSSMFLFYFRGASQRDLKRLDDALADFNRAIELDSTYFLTYHMRGMTYMDLGRNEPALADLSAAVRLEPTWASGYLMRGTVRDNLKDYDGALADWNKAVEIDPSNGDYVRRLVADLEKRRGK